MRHVAYAPDGRTLAAVTWGVHFFDAETLAPGQCFELQRSASMVAYAPDGQTLAVDSTDFSVQVWRANDGALLRTYKGHTGYLRGMAFSPDGRTLATASDDGTVRLWRAADGTLLHVLKHAYGVWDVAFSPDGELIASACGDALLWHVRSGNLAGRIEAQTGSIDSLAFAPDGRMLAIGDGTVYLFAVEDGQGELLHLLKDDALGKLDLVRSITFSPDGRLVAAAGVIWGEGTDTYLVGLWQTGDARFLARLLGPRGVEVSNVAFSPDGKTLASSWEDGIRLLEIAQVTGPGKQRE